jgi:aspartokinase-like uncharacterized kinase
VTPLPDPPPGLVVVKVGGSLYDRPGLGPGLRAFVERLDAPKVLIVAGGGPVVDVVRDLDSWHSLGEEASHELAMHGAHVAMHFLRRLLDLPPYAWTPAPEWWSAPHHRQHRVVSLMSYPFLMQYENLFGPVPHTWDLTSDSIAAYAAAVGKARLVLLKSVDVPPGTPWEEAAARGWVDRHFPAVVAAHGLRVEVVNFRRWLDDRAAQD